MSALLELWKIPSRDVNISYVEEYIEESQIEVKCKSQSLTMHYNHLMIYLFLR